MRTAVIAAIVTAFCASPVIGAADNLDQSGQEQGVEQKRDEMLRHIQERITNSQAEITCVSAARSHDELRACHEKFRPQRPVERRDNNRQN